MCTFLRRRLKDNNIEAESKGQLEEADIEMPSFDMQQLLLELYFTYTYSSFPIVDKEQLMADFNEMLVYFVSMGVLALFLMFP
jgi:hypothetical protein